MIIREAILEDCRQIYRLYQEEGWESFTLDKIQKLVESSYWLVLENEGEIVGFVRYLTDKLMTTYLCELVVAENHRCKGYASQMISEISIRHPKTRIDLISEADGFYDRLQFRSVGSGRRKSMSP